MESQYSFAECDMQVIYINALSHCFVLQVKTWCHHQTRIL